MPIFKQRIFTRKVIYRLFQLNVWTFQKCKNAHACALRDCLGVSRPFVSDTSPKCIYREGLERRRAGTRQSVMQGVDSLEILVALDFMCSFTWLFDDLCCKQTFQVRWCRQILLLSLALNESYNYSILVWVLLQDIFDLIRLSRRVHRTYLIIYELCFTCFKVEYKSSCIFQSSSDETIVEI